MPTLSKPDGTMPQMKQFEEDSRAAEAGMPQEMASTINLMAHPWAGAAAAGALGFGLASHAVGLWLGALAGIAEASRRMFEDEPAEPRPARPSATVTRLRLVEKTPAPAKAAAVKAAPAVADDLKAISGIGPKLEKVLNERGIRTYAQIAALDERSIARLDEELGFSGRIGRDDWIGQAKALSGGK